MYIVSVNPPRTHLVYGNRLRAEGSCIIQIQICSHLVSFDIIFIGIPYMKLSVSVNRRTCEMRIQVPGCLPPCQNNPHFSGRDGALRRRIESPISVQHTTACHSNIKMARNIAVFLHQHRIVSTRQFCLIVSVPVRDQRCHRFLSAHMIPPAPKRQRHFRNYLTGDSICDVSAYFSCLLRASVIFRHQIKLNINLLFVSDCHLIIHQRQIPLFFDNNIVLPARKRRPVIPGLIRGDYLLQFPVAAFVDLNFRAADCRLRTGRSSNPSDNRTVILSLFFIRIFRISRILCTSRILRFICISG